MVRDLLMIYQEHYAVQDEINFIKPVPLSRFREAGFSERDLVVYVRFMDILRSMTLFHYVSGFKKDLSLVESFSGLCETIVSDYFEFISEKSGYVVEPKFNFQKVLLHFPRITYNTNHSLHQRTYINEKSSILGLYTSLEYFRANVEIYTLHAFLGEDIKFEIEPDVESLSNDDLQEKAIKVKEAIDKCYKRQAVLNRYTPNDYNTIYEMQQIAETIGEKEFIELDIKELEEELDEYETAIWERKRESQFDQSYIAQRDASERHKEQIHFAMKYKKKESSSQGKCMYPSCSEQAIRRGFCWFHYQEEYYTSK